ncbi:necrosis inducing protein-domain-containing protein [Emericellopsis cladophorae]|uniref:Necrosis inducing protein-domain-containing protein n=1 Tax=Emericellopsis cladophorae TaxID=2686198 RepID=A0A9P9Y4V1_9HYPO|nr:necrosis inducing protein-domain-containing protein [Emericellopsis cladophorae]KAI6783451.1 necrosis inducing protein-domain-containing protein [Emericellopsis cladophorae]
MIPKPSIAGQLALLASVATVTAAPAPGLGIDIDATPHVFSRAVNPPTALPQSATANDLRWQPVLDFDTDGCYNVPAIDAAGYVAEGLEHNWADLASDCRDMSDLDNNNVYSRQRCNNGWCIYMYGYYFEKDVAIPNFWDPGHRHDWEHIVVWVNGSGAQYVAASQHGGWELRPASEVRWEGEHPKIVYHKDGPATHCFRFATTGDDNVANHKGYWFRGSLVSYNGFPGNTREKLFSHDFGKATIGFKDSTFESHIEKAIPSGVTFDSGRDEGSPGYP